MDWKSQGDSQNTGLGGCRDHSQPLGFHFLQERTNIIQGKGSIFTCDSDDSNKRILFLNFHTILFFLSFFFSLYCKNLLEHTT